MRDLSKASEFQKHLRQASTPAEYELWQQLRNRRIANCKFRRQHFIDPFFCDFYADEVQLIVECDGEPHFTEDGTAHDAMRDKFLTDKGCCILHIENKLILLEMQLTLETIRCAIERRRMHGKKEVWIERLYLAQRPSPRPSGTPLPR